MKQHIGIDPADLFIYPALISGLSKSWAGGIAQTHDSWLSRKTSKRGQPTRGRQGEERRFGGKSRRRSGKLKGQCHEKSFQTETGGLG